METIPMLDTLKRHCMGKAVCFVIVPEYMKLSTKDKELFCWVLQVNTSKLLKKQQVTETLVVFQVMEDSITPTCNRHTKSKIVKLSNLCYHRYKAEQPVTT